MIDAARCLWRREGDCVMVIKVMWHDNDNDEWWWWWWRWYVHLYLFHTIWNGPMTRWPLKVKIHQECKWILCGISNFPAAFKKKKTLTMIKDRNLFTLTDKVLYFKLFKELLRPHLYEVLYWEWRSSSQPAVNFNECILWQKRWPVCRICEFISQDLKAALAHALILSSWPS